MEPSNLIKAVSTNEFVSVQDVSFGYRNHARLFSGICFTVAPGEAVALTGPNGSGKSTLLRIVAGALSPSVGVIRRADNLRLVLLPTNMDHFLLPWYSIEKNVKFFNSRKEVQKRSSPSDYLSIIRQFFPGLAEEGGAIREIYKLSTGEKAVIGYACALETNPNCLVLDELFGNLSVSLIPVLIDHIRAFLRAGKSLCFTSHDPDIIRTLATKTICLS